MELFSPTSVSFSFVVSVFSSNDSTLVVNMATLPAIRNYSLIAVGSPIKRFSLAMDTSHELKAFIVQLRDGTWKTAFVKYTQGMERDRWLLVGISSLSSDLFPGSGTISDAISYRRSERELGYALLRTLEGGQTQIAFANFEEWQVSPVIYAVINITNAPAELKLGSFLQMGATSNTNRTLITIHDGSTIRTILPPVRNTSIPRQPLPTPYEFTLDWNDAYAPSTMYKFEVGQAFHAQFFSEVHLRAGLSVPYLWLSSVVDVTQISEKTSVVELRMFPEFGKDWSGATTLNPFAISSPPCEYNRMWNDSGVCKERPSRVLFTMPSVIVHDMQVRSIPSAPWLENFFPPGFPGSNWTTPAVSAVFIVERAFMRVYGITPVVKDAFATIVEEMNLFSLLGDSHRLAVSENGLHALPIVEKPKWEIDSINRYADICDMVKNETGLDYTQRAALQPWKTPCSSGAYRRPNSGDFVQYLSLCPIGSFCPTSNLYLVGGIYPGYYAPYPITMVVCPPGSYCPAGIRRICPTGFICPREMTLLPTPCPVETLGSGMTCWADGLAAPIPAQSGTIPMYAHYPPIPAPPGFYASHNNVTGFIDLAECSTGEYCPLGRDSRENRQCPPGAYCPESDNVFPLPCTVDVGKNYCSYCPLGSTKDEPCPAGFYCTGPQLRTQCVQPYYCPSGSLSAQLCPAGFYCPTPSEKLICPKRHYCELGTVVPTPCAILSICPAGTKNNSANFILALVFVVVIVILVVTWRVLETRTTRRRAEHSRKMQDAEKLLQRTKLQQQSSSDSGSDQSVLSPSSSMQAGLINDMYDHDDDDDDDEGGRRSLLKKDSPEALAALINHDLHSRMEPVPFTVDISFKELGLKIKGTEKKVLDGVTGTIHHGRVTAVMGPSGAGKTTFMSTLANKAHYGDRTGSILLNGQVGDLTLLPGLVGFVPQDDVMLRELSVTEILTFNAKMRLPAELEEEDVLSQVRRTIRLLGLYDIRHELIGDETKRGISGGQRKRVNIGMELVARPTVLFLDEPTSGLDATASLDVCGILRRVAEEAGITVISVIHQPRYDIFTMFHDVLLLGKGGRTVYLGPTADAVAYFESLGFEMPAHCNPADFLIDVVSGSVPRKGHPEYVKEDLFQLWIDHQKQKKDSVFETDAELTDSEYNDVEVKEAPRSSISRPSLPSPSSMRPSKAIKLLGTNQQEPFILPREAERRTSSGFHQLAWFFLRSLVQQKRNWISILTDVILVVISAITFGIVFLDSHYIGPPSGKICSLMPVSGLVQRCMLPVDDPFPQIALMTTIGLALPAAMAALRVFGQERVVFWRESSVGANTASYYVGKELGFFPSSILLPLLYAGVFYNFTVPRMNFGLMYLIFFATWWCATGLALAISVLVPPTLATISTVVVVFGMSMFSGVRPTLIELKKMWPPFSLISYVSFFRWLTEAYYVSEIWQWRTLYNISTGLKAMNYHVDSFAMCIGIVFATGLGFRILALLCLEFMNRDQRK